MPPVHPDADFDLSSPSTLESPDEGKPRLAGAWKWGWFGEAGKGTTQEAVYDLGNGVKLTLCCCPPGTFLMGSPATETGRQEDEIQHEVTLTQGFWMARTETTQAPLILQSVSTAIVS